ncbi:hypothetical protein [Deinococcus xianganensis]|uniref:AbrB/MazE/SpoVT family DNA-binding domain-containing protein n=1 Tax=Deinococcus xianganensis TaxID=1507289 RepID=A0A6I4YI47_9DEIO|nr:hypothetical protein [Deinococcus xianganensis]MXV19646.1 hypothetical protein [Deinococcus xianganensis]
MRLKLTGTAAGGVLLLPDDLLVQGGFGEVGRFRDEVEIELLPDGLLIRPVPPGRSFQDAKARLAGKRGLMSRLADE